MDKKVFLVIGIIVIVLLMSGKKDFQFSEQSNYVLPTSTIGNITQQAYLYYGGDHIGVVNYSSTEKEVLLFYNPDNILLYYSALPEFAGALSTDIRYEVYSEISDLILIYRSNYYLYDLSNDYYNDYYLKVNAFFGGIQIPEQITAEIPRPPEYPLSLPSILVQTETPITVKIYRSERTKNNIQYHGLGEGINWIEVASKEFSLNIIINNPQISVSNITETSAQVNIKTIKPTQRGNITFEIYKEGINLETKAVRVQEDIEYSVEFTNLTRSTNYSVNYYGIINGALEFRTLGEVIPVKIIPLSTEITENSFLQTFLVDGANPEIEITLVYGTTVEDTDYQYDGEKYLTRFSYLEPSTTYTYTIKAYEYGYETENYDIYTNTFRTLEEIDTTTKVIIEESYLKDKKFYTKFRIDGYYNDKEFVYRVKGGEILNMNITKFAGYYSLKTPELDEGDYEWRLLVTTDEGDITKEGTFKVYETIPTYTPPPTTTPPENGKTNRTLIMCIIVIIGVIIYYFRKRW